MITGTYYGRHQCLRGEKALIQLCDPTTRLMQLGYIWVQFDNLALTELAHGWHKTRQDNWEIEHD